jgi:hypothetical protein
MSARIGWAIRLAVTGGLVALLATARPTGSHAQAESKGQPPRPAIASVPTTKILAIGRLTAKATPKSIAPILPSEIRATARLYLSGKIDQWFYETDETGVVFILNLSNAGEARALLEALPLGQAGMMEFELISLGPLKPLALLLAEPSKPAH